MHELSIARAVVAEVAEAAQRHDAAAVTSVTLRIGRLSGVVADALRFGLELTVPGTALAGAEIEIVDDPVVVWCPEGGHAVELDELRFRCPVHGCATPDVLSGRRLEIVRFEIPDEPTPGAVHGVHEEGAGRAVTPR